LRKGRTQMISMRRNKCGDKQRDKVIKRVGHV